MPAIGVMTPGNCLPRGIDPGEKEKAGQRRKNSPKNGKSGIPFEFVARSGSPSMSRRSPKSTPKNCAAIWKIRFSRSLAESLSPNWSLPTFLQLVQPSERLGHHETAHKLMRLCGQVTRYARITGRVKYDVAAGLTEALTPVQTTHFAAVTLPDDIGQLLRDIDAYVGYTSVVYCLKILPYVFTRPLGIATRALE